jgi:hypothetical protein
MDPITGAAVISAGSSLLGGLFGRSSAKKAAAKEAALQREFAQNGIRWKVEDAKSAGVSPLYALGAPTTSYQSAVNSDPFPQALADAGNSISRAVQAKTTTGERLQERLLNAQIEGQEIENAKKRSEVALQTGAMSTPPLPSSHYSGEVVPMYSKVRTPYGDKTMVSDAYGQVLENDMTEYLRYLPRDFLYRAKEAMSKYNGPWNLWGYKGRR